MRWSHLIAHKMSNLSVDGVKKSAIEGGGPMKLDKPSAVERSLKVQEMIVRAMREGGSGNTRCGDHRDFKPGQAAMEEAV